MGYTDDWEKIMNGAFGSGGRAGYGPAGGTAPAQGGAARAGKAGTAADPFAGVGAAPSQGGAARAGKAGAAADPFAGVGTVPAQGGAARAGKASTAADPFAGVGAAPSQGGAAAQADSGAGTFDLSQLSALTQALQEQQRALDTKLKAQQEALRRSDDSTAQALADSRRMLKDMEADGLLAEGTSEVPPEQRGSFEGLAAAVRQNVLGQDAFVDSLVRAMRRPFVMGTQPPRARNVILITGAAGTGRHYALACTAREMAARGLLKSDAAAALDLSLYANPGAEKLFLQDLYAALHAPGELLLLENYEDCHPGFLRVLSDLAVKGSAPLSTRYLVRDGILVDAGTALVPGAVGQLDPCGKYLIFFSGRGREAIADKFGAPMVEAIGDVCQTGAYTPESLTQLAAQQLNALAQKVKAQLNMTLSAGADVRDYVAGQCTKARGAAGLSDACGKMFRALSEYCLQSETAAAKTAALSVRDGVPYFSPDGAEARRLYDLLPAEYTGALEAVQAEMDDIVGLAEVKRYVLDLADNVRVQQRRAAAGMKTASLSMHMIFTGNPGTGKTTIARIVARYLKAIGALSGGQLVEVTRADLVGRYTGHTAPLTNSVIQSALGGVLFIDEAYGLYRGEQDSFGLEAIDTLVKGMEDHRDELVVILAGYSKEMAVFLQANSGLASRFPNQIEFPDYTGEELLAITKCLCRGKAYKMDADCDMPLLHYYSEQQAVNAAKAGNGRLARNTLERAILNQSRRLVAEPEAALDQLKLCDFDFGKADADAAAASAAAQQAAPESAAAPQGTPAAPDVPAGNTPAEGTPAESAPAENTPAEGTPAENAPAENTPAESSPARKKHWWE